MKLIHSLTAMLTVALADASSVAGQDARYALFELRPLVPEDQFAGVRGIDAHGVIAGYAGTDGANFHAVRWDKDGRIVDLGTLGGKSSAASAINELGEIAGWANHDPGGSLFDQHACVWTANGLVDLGTLGGESSWANGMNDVGQVVGESEYEGGRGAKAFLWQNGQMEVLPAPFEGSDGRAAYDVNDQGQTVGYGGGLDGQYNALLWRNGEVFDLGSLDGNGSAAEAINDHGVIAGRSETATSRHAVIWVDQQIIDIHSLGIEWWSWARGINNSGTVVGFAVGPPGFVAFVREPGRPMEIMNKLVPPHLRLPWRISEARSINDAGQIATEGELDSQPANLWAFLLSPVHPTMEMAPPSPGVAGTSNTISITGATPGARVVFLYARHGGGARIPGCDLQQNALQLDSPTIIGSAIANQNGVATITRNVPLIARGQTILFQAVAQSECAISQLVVHQFE